MKNALINSTIQKNNKITTGVIIASSSFNNNELGIALCNAEFEHFEEFSEMTLELLVKNTKVSIKEIEENQQIVLRARYSFVSVKYFIKFDMPEKTGKLEGYVKMLIT